MPYLRFCLNWFFVLWLRFRSFLLSSVRCLDAQSPKYLSMLVFFYMLFEAFLFFFFFYIYSYIHPVTKWRNNENKWRAKKLYTLPFVIVCMHACFYCYASKCITFIILKMFDVVFISSGKTRNPQRNTHSFSYECHTYTWNNHRHCELWIDTDSRIVYIVVYGHICTCMRACSMRLYIVFDSHQTRGKKEKCYTYQQPVIFAVTLPLRLRLHFNTLIYH